MKTNRRIEVKRYSSSIAPAVWVIVIEGQHPSVMSDGEIASLVEQVEAEQGRFADGAAREDEHGRV